MIALRLQLVGAIGPFAPPMFTCASVDLTHRDFVAALPTGRLRRAWDRLLLGAGPRAAVAVRVQRDGRPPLVCTALLSWEDGQQLPCDVVLRADALRHDIREGDVLELVARRWWPGRIA